jgi:AraC-like DNA-binding protein
MNDSFEKVDDWPKEAKHCGYRVRQMALHLGISVRWLELYLKKRFGKRPRELFSKWREREIRRLAFQGKTGKEMLDEVHLAHCSSLTRSLLNHGKRGLRELRRDRRDIRRK